MSGGQEQEPGPVRTWPDTCPACHQPTDRWADPHCESNERQVAGCCPWIKCSCGAVIDRAGRHVMGPPRRS